MVNTKRQNKIKKLKKRVSRKFYGGDSSEFNNSLSKSSQKYNPITNYNKLQNQMSDKLTNSLPDYNKLQNQMSDKLNSAIPDYNKLQNQMSDKLNSAIPNYNALKDNLAVPNSQNVLSQLMSVGAQLANKGMNYGLSTISNLTGTDPNLSAEESINALKNKAQNIANVISTTDLGNQLGEQLEEATNKILSPAVEKGSDILNELAKKEEKAVVGLGANLAEDVAYPIVAPIRTALSGLQVVENTAEAASEATGVLKEQVEAYNEVKDKIGQTLEEISDIASKNVVPESLYETPNINESLDQFNNNITNSQNQYSDDEPVNEESLKQINKEGTMVGGRILSSQLEFLRPFHSSSKTMKKRKNKKRNIRKTKHRL